MAKKVLVLIGTRKGAFVAESDESRTGWKVRGPFCEGRQTMDVNFDPATGNLLAATAGPGGSGLFEAMAVKCPECSADPFNFCTGPDGAPLQVMHAKRKLPTGVWRSGDLGETWTFSDAGLSFGEDGPEIAKVWNVQPAPGGVIYAGVEPAGLFKSTDGGATWESVAGLNHHPSRSDWHPGNGGLCLHSIVVHPEDGNRIWVGTSAAGAFMTTDGGKTWGPANKNVRNFDQPMGADDVEGCVHKLRGALNGRDLLYQQNHFGVYRSNDGGKEWQEISAGLSSDFGFGMAVHPHDHKSIYVVPLAGDGRFMPDGKAAVWRSRDGGDTWTRQDKGLPQEGAFCGVLREGMASDTLDVPGIYFGTNTGEDGVRVTPMPTLVLPASLTQLFPGAPRRVDVAAEQAASVSQALDCLDERWPGMRSRLCDTPDSLRRHITVFVDSSQAGLSTPLRPDAEVRIIPALSGG